MNELFRVILRFKKGDAICPIQSFIDPSNGMPFDSYTIKCPFTNKMTFLKRTRFSCHVKKALVYKEV